MKKFLILISIMLMSTMAAADGPSCMEMEMDCRTSCAISKTDEELPDCIAACVEEYNKCVEEQD